MVFLQIYIYSFIFMILFLFQNWSRYTMKRLRKPKVGSRVAVILLEKAS
jgi:hypothetical protein